MAILNFARPVRAIDISTAGAKAVTIFVNKDGRYFGEVTVDADNELLIKMNCSEAIISSLQDQINEAYYTLGEVENPFWAAVAMFKARRLEHKLKPEILHHEEIVERCNDHFASLFQ